MPGDQEILAANEAKIITVPHHCQSNYPPDYYSIYLILSAQQPPLREVASKGALPGSMAY